MLPTDNQDEIPYHDVPEIAERYADYLQTISVSGQVVTLTFCVRRVEEAATDNRRLARYTSSRLVIPTTAFIQFYDKMTRLMKRLESQGALKRSTQQTPTTVQ